MQHHALGAPADREPDLSQFRRVEHQFQRRIRRGKLCHPRKTGGDLLRGGRHGGGRRDRVRAATGRDAHPGFCRVLPGEEIRPGHRRSRTVLTLHHEEGGTGPRRPIIVGGALRFLGWVMGDPPKVRLIDGGAGGGENRDSTSFRTQKWQIGRSWCGFLTVHGRRQLLRRSCR